MDNEYSNALRQLIVDDHTNNLQLVPPYDHRTNQAEKSIETFKCYLISGISAVAPIFPLYLWCYILYQVEKSLAMLRISNLYPHMSSYTHVHGVFYYNKTPFASPGINTLVYETPIQRRTWAQYSVVVWYIGSYMDHYHYYKCYVPAARYKRDASTVSF